MRSIYTKAVLLGLAAGSIPPAWAQPSSFVVPLRWQLASEWCWAASAQMAMVALQANEQDVLQRIQAGRRYPPVNDCFSNACDGGTASTTCNFGGFPQFEKFGFDAEVTPPDKPLAWSELERELSCPRPVVFAVEDLDHGNRTGTGHMLVAKSGGIVDNSPWIAVNDPAPLCEGSIRAESYQEYLGGTNKAHWIDYYHLHKTATALTECAPPAPRLSPFEIRESDSPGALVEAFITALNNESAPNKAWIRNAAGLIGDSDLNCENSPEVAEKSISTLSLGLAPFKTFNGPWLVDSGRHRFLCRNGTSQIFSVEVEKQPTGKWRVATIGDAQLAARLSAIQAANPGEQIQEVFVRGLNLRFALPVDDKSGIATPLFSIPTHGIAPGPQNETDLLNKLREAGKDFRASGPT